MERHKEIFKTGKKFVLIWEPIPVSLYIITIYK